MCVLAAVPRVVVPRNVVPLAVPRSPFRSPPSRSLPSAGWSTVVLLDVVPRPKPSPGRSTVVPLLRSKSSLRWGRINRTRRHRNRHRRTHDRRARRPARRHFGRGRFACEFEGDPAETETACLRDRASDEASVGRRWMKTTSSRTSTAAGVPRGENVNARRRIRGVIPTRPANTGMRAGLLGWRPKDTCAVLARVQARSSPAHTLRPLRCRAC